MAGTKTKNCEFIVHVGKSPHGLTQVLSSEQPESSIDWTQLLGIQKAFPLNPLLLKNEPTFLQTTLTSPKEQISLPSTGTNCF